MRITCKPGLIGAAFSQRNVRLELEWQLQHAYNTYTELTQTPSSPGKSETLGLGCCPVSTVITIESGSSRETTYWESETESSPLVFQSDMMHLTVGNRIRAVNAVVRRILPQNISQTAKDTPQETSRSELPNISKSPRSQPRHRCTSKKGQENLVHGTDKGATKIRREVMTLGCREIEPRTLAGYTCRFY